MADGTIATNKEDTAHVSSMPRCGTKAAAALEWRCRWKAGKRQVDLLVLDQVGGRSNRQLFTVKIK